jgi:hypothetical protein
MLKPSLAVIAALVALAAPLSAQAHRGWLAPSATVLSGTDAWVGFDAAMSNGVFIADHAAMRLEGLVITGPDGATLSPENMMQGRYRSTFDAHLTRPGTYRIANVSQGMTARYVLDGETRRWRGAEADFPTALPAGATDIEASRASSRTETYVTLGAPTTAIFAPTGEGLELAPVTHPNDLVSGETASFGFLMNGRPAADLTVTVARGGSRYRDDPEDLTLTTDAAGTLAIAWAEPGLYWIHAAVRTLADGTTPATSAQYNGVVEVLP